MYNELIKRAENNDVDAILQLAEIYKLGEGVEKDLSKYTDYLKKAVELGSSDAMLKLSLCYINGEGEDKDEGKAFTLLKRAESIGDNSLRVSFGLGNCYLKGIGTPKNSALALMHFTILLGANYDPEGIVSLWYDEAVNSIDTKAYVDWLFKVSEQLPYAQFKLGEMYENGCILELNRNLAIEMYSKSASKGCIDAKMNLAILYNKSDVVGEKGLAEKLLKEVLDAHYEPEFLRASRVLATLYSETGREDEAIRIFTDLAEKHNDAVSCGMLGIIYNESNNRQLARQWYDRAYSISGDEKYKDMVNSINMVIQTGGTSTEKTTSSGGCYVATAIYGSYDCPQVWTLRRYRDESLDSVWIGKLFIKIYYAVSPVLVKWFGKTKIFRLIFKKRLDKFVKRLNESGVDNTPYNDKEY